MHPVKIERRVPYLPLGDLQGWYSPTAGQRSILDVAAEYGNRDYSAFISIHENTRYDIVERGQSYVGIEGTVELRALALILRKAFPYQKYSGFYAWDAEYILQEHHAIYYDMLLRGALVWMKNPLFFSGNRDVFLEHLFDSVSQYADMHGAERRTDTYSTKRPSRPWRFHDTAFESTLAWTAIMLNEVFALGTLHTPDPSGDSIWEESTSLVIDMARSVDTNTVINYLAAGARLGDVPSMLSDGIDIDLLTVLNADRDNSVKLVRLEPVTSSDVVEWLSSPLFGKLLPSLNDDEVRSKRWAS